MFFWWKTPLKKVYFFYRSKKIKLILSGIFGSQFMMKTETVTYCNICSLTDCCDIFQARNIKTGDLAAVKIIKLEPGKWSYYYPIFSITVLLLDFSFLGQSLGIRLGHTKSNNENLLINRLLSYMLWIIFFDEFH